MRITGQNIHLRDLEPRDFEAYRDWFSGQHPWMELDAPYYDKPTQEEVESLLERVQTKFQMGYPNRRRKFLAIALPEEDRFIGTVTWYWQSQPSNWKSIGIVIYDESLWGKGIGTEALAMWIDFLFDLEPDLHRLDLRTWSGNSGMMGLALKLGFREEARFVDARAHKGQLYDGMAYGILRREWENR